MEEEFGSPLSNAEKSIVDDVSDSNSSTRQSAVARNLSDTNSSTRPSAVAITDSDSGSRIHPSVATKKRERTNSSSIGPSNFKGVVPQQNGNWGCQIYANHQRIWLGTFKSEKEAAMAYDSASIKLRSLDSRRNYPLTDATQEETNFQSHYSTEAIINMIKDGSYQSRLVEFVKTCTQTVETELKLHVPEVQNSSTLTCKQLFQKELTPSDVGKLNRLVIPKKYAVKYFPQFSNDKENLTAKELDDVQLTFYDGSMKPWKFRYCYWRSSQSFVFTRGWNRFVKEKKLKAHDTITFCLCESRENAKVTRRFYMIDIKSGENRVAGEGEEDVIEAELQLQRGPNVKEEVQKDETLLEEQGFKLFGVRIIID